MIRNLNIKQAVSLSAAIVVVLLFGIASSYSQMAKSDSSDAGTSLPTSQSRTVFTSFQDEAFQKALDLQLPFSLRARLDLELSEPLWQLANRSLDKNPWVSAMNSLNSMPDGVFNPSDVQIVQWQTNIMNSMYVPFMKTYSPYGTKVDFETIGKFLGLVEDVSPVIQYNLSITADVEIVIYSVQATVIATLFNGVQSPGNYTINWNARDSKGRQMPPGDYIAEVRIGKDRYVRKRIVLK